MELNIKWHIDHADILYGYILTGDFMGQRYCEIVREGWFGYPLMYKKWKIKRQFRILFKEALAKEVL